MPTTTIVYASDAEDQGTDWSSPNPKAVGAPDGITSEATVVGGGGTSDLWFTFAPNLSLPASATIVSVNWFVWAAHTEVPENNNGVYLYNSDADSNSFELGISFGSPTSATDSIQPIGGIFNVTVIRSGFVLRLSGLVPVNNATIAIDAIGYTVTYSGLSTPISLLLLED